MCCVRSLGLLPVVFCRLFVGRCRRSILSFVFFSSLFPFHLIAAQNQIKSTTNKSTNTHAHAHVHKTQVRTGGVAGGCVAHSDDGRFASIRFATIRAF